MPEKTSGRKGRMRSEQDAKGPKEIGSWLNAVEVAIILALSVLFAGSNQYIERAYFSFNLEFFARLLTFVVVFAFFVVAVKYLFMRKPSSFALPAAFTSLPEWARFALMVLLMLIAWAPIVISLYPGAVSPDTMAQLASYINAYVEQDGTIVTDQHPPFTTWVFGWFFVAAGSVLGSVRYSLFAYVILQAIATACAFSACVRYLERLGLSQLWQLGVFLVFCLHPLFPIMVSNISKDAFFSWAFFLFVMGFIEIFRTSGKVLGSWRFIVAISVAGVLCCLTKNFGVYVVAPSLLVAVLVFRKDAVKALIPCALSLAVTFGGVPAAETATGVATGASASVIKAVPLQQTARYVIVHDDEVTEEERAAIEAVMGDYEILKGRYVSNFADPVLNAFRGASTEEERSEFWKVWLAQGLKHPFTYVEAWAALEAQWFSFTPIYALFNNDHYRTLAPQFKGAVPDDTYGHNWFTDRASDFVDESYYALNEIPFVGILLSQGFFVTLIPLLSLILTLRGRDKRQALALVPVFLVFAKLLISPTSIGGEAMRYAICFVFLSPLLVSFGKSCFLTGLDESLIGDGQREGGSRAGKRKKPKKHR